MAAEGTKKRRLWKRFISKADVTITSWNVCGNHGRLLTYVTFSDLPTPSGWITFPIPNPTPMRKKGQHSE